jgi:hypothetical protein
VFRISTWLATWAVVVGCFGLSGCVPAKASVSVSDLTSTFPAIQRLGVIEFEHQEFNEGEPDCDALVYKRGAFASIPRSGTCGTFSGSTEVPVEFDPEATADLATVAAEFDRIKVPMRYALIKSGVDGAVGAESTFAADGCVTYVYYPGWTSLPDLGKEIATGIDENWYRVDSCP